MTPRDVLREQLERLVRFEPPDRPLDAVVEDLRALHLYARRNGQPQQVVDLLRACGALGSQCLGLVRTVAGLEQAVGDTFRAMVYATVDHALIRTVLATSHWNLFTLLTTGASFVLDRMAEYAYVQSARTQKHTVVHGLQAGVVDELWEALARNPNTDGLTWEECRSCRELVGRVRALVESPESTLPALNLATLLLYVTMLQALQAVQAE